MGFLRQPILQDEPFKWLKMGLIDEVTQSIQR
jgi:hypothetical protein